MNNPIFIITLAMSILIECSGQSNVEEKLRAPVAGLPTADLISVGMNEDSIKKLVQLINTTPPDDFRAMVIIKNNKLVVEEYFNTYWRETINDIRPVGKSITSLLVGIAI